jgi:hypothetical protein
MPKYSSMNGADRLALTARAAGFAMATPDDRPEDPVPAVATAVAVRTASTWRPAQPARSLSAPALSSPASRRTNMQASIRDWMAALTWRAPA